MKPHLDESEPYAFTVVGSPVGRPRLRDDARHGLIARSSATSSASAAVDVVSTPSRSSNRSTIGAAKPPNRSIEEPYEA